MSSNNSKSSSSYSFSTSFSSSIGGQTSGQTRSEKVISNPSGSTVTTSSQSLGEAAQQETRRYDHQGRELTEGADGNNNNSSNRITDTEQAEHDREYEERIEEEYAKREGGA